MPNNQWIPIYTDPFSEIYSYDNPYNFLSTKVDKNYKTVTINKKTYDVIIEELKLLINNTKNINILHFENKIRDFDPTNYPSSLIIEIQESLHQQLQSEIHYYENCVNILDRIMQGKEFEQVKSVYERIYSLVYEKYSVNDRKYRYYPRLHKKLTTTANVILNDFNKAWNMKVNRILCK